MLPAAGLCVNAASAELTPLFFFAVFERVLCETGTNTAERLRTSVSRGGPSLTVAVSPATLDARIDLGPLESLKLTRLIFTPGRITAGIEQVRAMKSLRELDSDFKPDKRPTLSPAEFWSLYDAGKFKK